MKLLIAPTTNAVGVPVVLDLQESSGVTVKAALSASEFVEVKILIGGDLRHYATITVDKPLATLPGGEIYAVTKSATSLDVGVFLSPASHVPQQQQAGENAVLWGPER